MVTNSVCLATRQGNVRGRTAKRANGRTVGERGHSQGLYRAATAQRGYYVAPKETQAEVSNLNPRRRRAYISLFNQPPSSPTVKTSGE